jgi:hypothetical protein
MRRMPHGDYVVQLVLKDWPPAKRCGNCRHWHSGWLALLFGLRGKMGKCRVINDTSWHSYTCASHSPPPIPW